MLVRLLRDRLGTQRDQQQRKPVRNIRNTSVSSEHEQLLPFPSTSLQSSHPHPP